MIWGIRILNTMILEKYKIKTFDKLKKKIKKKNVENSNIKKYLSRHELKCYLEV